MAICVKIGKQTILVISSYLDYNDTGVIPDLLEKALEYACNKTWALLLGRDSNCHSVLYAMRQIKGARSLKTSLQPTISQLRILGKPLPMRAGKIKLS